MEQFMNQRIYSFKSFRFSERKYMRESWNRPKYDAPALDSIKLYTYPSDLVGFCLIVKLRQSKTKKHAIDRSALRTRRSKSISITVEWSLYVGFTPKLDTLQCVQILVKYSIVGWWSSYLFWTHIEIFWEVSTTPPVIKRFSAKHQLLVANSFGVGHTFLQWLEVARHQRRFYIWQLEACVVVAVTNKLSR